MSTVTKKSQQVVEPMEEKLCPKPQKKQTPAVTILLHPEKQIQQQYQGNKAKPAIIPRPKLKHKTQEKVTVPRYVTSNP